jgi:hypothetical protein
MHNKSRATAPTVAHLESAHSCQTTHSFFRPSRHGAQIHVGHLFHLHACARVCANWVSDAEARALLNDIADDCARVMILAYRANTGGRSCDSL